MAESLSASKDPSFAGYENLQSNYVYTPNQFFDVVVPHSDRGVLRIVGYLIRRQLGYITPQGEIQEPVIGVSHRELVSKSKVSSGALTPALRKAIDLNFIEEIRPGRANSKGSKGEKALYALKWDKSADHYEKDIHEFQGFWAKDSNRTPIPNQFFDVTLKQEAFSVSGVVGMVIRWSIGFQTEFGHRRTETALSANRIAELIKLGPTIVKKSIKTAISKGYIECVEKGVFDSRSVVRKASVYRVHWSDSQGNASKSDPANQPHSTGSYFETPQKVTQPNASKSDSGTPQKVTQPNASKSDPLKRNKVKETFKQQQSAGAAEEFLDEKISRLREAGFDFTTARILAGKADLDVIENQIRWIDQRNASSNKMGLLRKAIEENFEEPEGFQQKGPGSDFIREFQTGYGNEKSQWLSPSLSEIRLASDFAQKLVEDFGGNPETWGQEFGKFVKYELGNRHRSFEKTVRFQSEKFIAIQKSRIASEKTRKRQWDEDEKIRIQDEQHKQWLAYVDEEISEIENFHPERMREFKERRAKERAELASDPSPVNLSLVIFDREDSFLEALAEEFSDIVLTEDKFIMNVKQ